MKKQNHLFSATSARALLLTILCGLLCGLPLTAAIPTDGLVAYYPLNGNANDESGNGYHATPCNSYQFEDGVVGECITVEGEGYLESSGGHVLLPQFDFDASSGITLSLWVKSMGMTHSDGEAYISLGDETVKDGLQIKEERNSNVIEFMYHETIVTAPCPEDYTGKWVMYTLTCGADGKLKGYVNGAIAVEEDVEYDGQINTSPAALGRHWWNSGLSTSTRFNGSFDEVRIYNRALSQKEILALYSRNSTDGLVAYYPLNGNTNDESGNGYHATPCNSYQFEDGVVGGCITVEGEGYLGSSGGHVLLPQFDFDASSGVTLSLWVKSSGIDYPDGEAYISFGDETVQDGLQIKEEPYCNAIQFMYHKTTISVPYQEGYTGKWVMYTLTCGADGKLKAYVNGAIAGEGEVDYNGQINTSPAALGRHWWNSGTSTSTRFNGSFDEVRIYNRALSQKEILALYGRNAQPDDIWTMPEPEGLEFTTFTDDGTRYYLYNPATKMFFSSGNGWNTQASLRTFGMEIWLQEATEPDAPEGSYELWDNNANNSARYTGENHIFTDDGNASWVDRGTQGNYSWAYEIVGDCVRFQNVAFIADKPEYSGMYLGFDGTYVMDDNPAYDGRHLDAYTAVLRHAAPTAPGASVDWKAVTVESYEAFVASDSYQAYVDGAKQYIASIGLKHAIEEAEALYIDVTDALAVYTNTESTPDQLKNAANDLAPIINVKKRLKNAIEDHESDGFTATGDAKAVLTNMQATLEDVEQAHKDLDAAFIEWGKSHASMENPINMTMMIVNYSFDNGDCTTGWSGTAFGRGGTVSDGAEHYSKTYDTYQKISGLAPGIYAVGVNGYYRAGNYGGDAENHWLANDADSKAAKFYGVVGDNYFETSIANVLSGAQPENQNVGDVAVNYTDENGDPVTVYAPNTMAAGDYYFHTLHQYANKLYVTVDEAGELTIGVKKPTSIGGDWSMFDDFSLTFFGNGADAWKLFLEDGWNYEELELDEDEVLFTASYLEAYNAIATQDLSSLNTPEQIKAALAEVKAAYDALQKNIDLWKQWKAAVQKTNDRVTDLGWTDPWTMQDGVADYLYEVEDIEMDRELTNEELEAEIAKIAALIEACEKFAKENLKPGTDVTFYIQNADFESGVH
ncbi:MAG: LamG domain-containing protein, partial [Prevotella sp.]|nr:LamG domain-containing protein [Prevotella sp.]